MQNNIILHIGLGRTSTTTFQRSIFPKLSKMFNYKYVDHSRLDVKNQDPDLKKISEHIRRMQHKKKSKALNIQGKVLISSENLCCWNPIFYEQFSEDNLIAFGKNAHVVLVIREPLVYLNSIYNHQIIRAVPNYKKPSEFFIDSRKHSNIKFCTHASDNFTIDFFNYKKLINFYRKRFNKITIIKYEFLEDMQFLNKLFPIDSLAINKLKKEYQINFLNKSVKISKLTLFVSYILFVLRYRIIQITQLYNKINNRKNNKNNRSKNDLNKLKTNIYKKIFNFLFLGRGLYTEDLSKIYILKLINNMFNVKNHELKLNKYIDKEIIEKLNEEYLQIPNTMTYIKKQS